MPLSWILLFYVSLVRASVLMVDETIGLDKDIIIYDSVEDYLFDSPEIDPQIVESFDIPFEVSPLFRLFLHEKQVTSFVLFDKIDLMTLQLALRLGTLGTIHYVMNLLDSLKPDEWRPSLLAPVCKYHNDEKYVISLIKHFVHKLSAADVHLALLELVVHKCDRKYVDALLIGEGREYWPMYEWTCCEKSQWISGHYPLEIPFFNIISGTSMYMDHLLTLHLILGSEGYDYRQKFLLTRTASYIGWKKVFSLRMSKQLLEKCKEGLEKLDRKVLLKWARYSVYCSWYPDGFIQFLAQDGFMIPWKATEDLLKFIPLRYTGFKFAAKYLEKAIVNDELNEPLLFVCLSFLLKFNIPFRLTSAQFFEKVTSSSINFDSSLLQAYIEKIEKGLYGVQPDTSGNLITLLDHRGFYSACIDDPKLPKELIEYINDYLLPLNPFTGGEAFFEIISDWDLDKFGKIKIEDYPVPSLNEFENLNLEAEHFSYTGLHVAKHFLTRDIVN